jgi:RNA polymerase sigma factor (sigma-70 family)
MGIHRILQVERAALLLMALSYCSQPAGRLSEKEEQAVSATDLISAVERKLTSEQVASACRHLKEAQQEVISLRFSGGLSTAEVAKIMDKTEGAVKALQHSALKSLRAILGQEAE